VIVEIGCDLGGTLYAWQQVGIAEVFGITLEDHSYEAGGSKGKVDYHGVRVLTGDSHDPWSLAWLRDRLVDHRQIDALILDGDHHVEGVRSDLAMYGPLVREGGLILLHDIAVTHDPRAEVHKVWPEISGHAVELDCVVSEIVSKAFPLGWGVIKVGRGGFRL
jgi:cephalosporin hydroxylase